MPVLNCGSPCLVAALKQTKNMYLKRCTYRLDAEAKALKPRRHKTLGLSPSGFIYVFRILNTIDPIG